MNPDLSKLQPYPFEKLAKLKAAVSPNAALEHISLSIGEPKHPSPAFVQQAMIDNIQALENYPTTKGLPELSEACAHWLKRRFTLNRIDPVAQVIPVNGTREAIFAFAQAAVDRTQPHPLVLSPNPFYQIYEGAAYLAGAEPYFLPCMEATGFNADYASVPTDVWERCQLLFVCSPGNPTGSTLSIEQYKELIALADQYDFIVASDECYSELWVDGKEAPVGLLQACAELGRDDYDKCVVFHSLSKRSNLPGLRYCGRRQTAETFPAVPHLPRLCPANSDPNGRHRRLERRSPRGRQPPPVHAEIQHLYRDTQASHRHPANRRQLLPVVKNPDCR